MGWIDQMILIIGTTKSTSLLRMIAAVNIGQVESTPAHSVSDVGAGAIPRGLAVGPPRACLPSKARAQYQYLRPPTARPI
jgi:hypothetical protein